MCRRASACPSSRPGAASGVPAAMAICSRIETRIQEFRPKSLLFRFEFYPETGRDLLAEGTATLVAIGPDWRARKLPERIKKALSQGK